MRRITKPAFLTPSLCLIDLEANRLARSLLMLDQLPIIVPPSIQPHHPPCEEYCTVVFRLQGGRSAMGWFLAELSRHFEGSGTAEIVKFEVGDHLRNRR
ncbi:hypothetical protein PS663_00513 [Pseudomonas fluorescens]|nr:hypothetical protein PS663_00513 [Pseudomonas fluorescens]